MISRIYVVRSEPSAGESRHKLFFLDISEGKIWLVLSVQIVIGPIAQLVELPAHNRTVSGSNPLGSTIFLFIIVKEIEV